MSAVKGVNKTTLDAAAGPSSFSAKGVYDANVKCMIDYYEAAALANASTISMGPTLPEGARIVGVRLAHDALFGAGTVNVGDSADADRYLSAIDCSAAGVSVSDEVDGVDYVIGTASGDNQIVITVTGGSTATGTIRLVVFYTNA